MTKKDKAVPPAPADVEDIADCFDDTLSDEGITENDEMFMVPLGRPKDKFIRVNADKAYQRAVYLYTYKEEGEFGEEVYLVSKDMVKHVGDDARPAWLVLYVDREGNPGVWYLKRPKVAQGEKPLAAWTTAVSAAKSCMEKWGKVIWKGRSFYVRPAGSKYASDPDWSKFPPFDQLIALAFGEQRIIKDKEHPVYLDRISGDSEEESEEEGGGDGELE